MAKKNTINQKETMYNATALVYLKYGGERIAPGGEFKVKESHVEELKKKNCAKIGKAIVAAVDAGEDADQNTNPDATNGSNPDEIEDPEGKDNLKGKDNPKAGA